MRLARVLVLAGAACVLWADSASLAATAEPAAPKRLVVLDTTGFWRMHHVMASPVMQADGALTPIPDYDPNAKLGWQEGWLRPIALSN